MFFWRAFGKFIETEKMRVRERYEEVVYVECASGGVGNRDVERGRVDVGGGASRSCCW